MKQTDKLTVRDLLGPDKVGLNPTYAPPDRRTPPYAFEVVQFAAGQRSLADDTEGHPLCKLDLLCFLRLVRRRADLLRFPLEARQSRIIGAFLLRQLCQSHVPGSSRRLYGLRRFRRSAQSPLTVSEKHRNAAERTNRRVRVLDGVVQDGRL